MGADTDTFKNRAESCVDRAQKGPVLVYGNLVLGKENLLLLHCRDELGEPPPPRHQTCSPYMYTYGKGVCDLWGKQTSRVLVWEVSHPLVSGLRYYCLLSHCLSLPLGDSYGNENWKWKRVWGFTPENWFSPSHSYVHFAHIRHTWKHTYTHTHTHLFA